MFGDQVFFGIAAGWVSTSRESNESTLAQGKRPDAQGLRWSSNHLGRRPPFHIQTVSAVDEVFVCVFAWLCFAESTHAHVNNYVREKMLNTWPQ